QTVDQLIDRKWLRTLLASGGSLPSELEDLARKQGLGNLIDESGISLGKLRQHFWQGFSQRLVEEFKTPPAEHGLSDLLAAGLAGRESPEARAQRELEEFEAQQPQPGTPEWLDALSRYEHLSVGAV